MLGGKLFEGQQGADADEDDEIDRAIAENFAEVNLRTHKIMIVANINVKDEPEVRQEDIPTDPVSPANEVFDQEEEVIEVSDNSGDNGEMLLYEDQQVQEGLLNESQQEAEAV